MTAQQASAAMIKGIRAAVPSAQCVSIPMADGGEGTTQILIESLGGTFHSVMAQNCLGEPAEAQIGLIDTTAIIEASAVVGLEQIPPHKRDPMLATSRGIAKLILTALDLGATKFVVGLGGTAVNDCGAGMLQALGVKFGTKDGWANEVKPINFGQIIGADFSMLDARLKGVEILLATDVTNSLLGEHGATNIFGPQKGATSDQLIALEAGMDHIIAVLETAANTKVRNEPGAGAAGGLGAAFRLLGAQVKPGVEVIAELVGLEEAISKADLVLTGEGSVDPQTLNGKTPAGVAKIAKKHNVPVIVFGGRVDPKISQMIAQRDPAVTFLAAIPIVPSVMTLPQALATGPQNLEQSVMMALRLFCK